MASIWGMRKVASGGLEACHSGTFLLPLAPDFLGPDQHMLRNEVFLSHLFSSLSPILQPPHLMRIPYIHTSHLPLS